MRNSFYNNLFGTIAEGAGLARLPQKIGFLPEDDMGNTLKIKGTGANWMGLRSREMQLKAYMFCSPLSSVIDRLAEADINGKPEILRKTGKGKNDYAGGPYADNLNALFSQPNPLQTWHQFRGQQVVYKKIFGFCPVWAIRPAGFNDTSDAYQLINIHPWCFNVESTKKLYRQTAAKDIISKYVFTVLGEDITLTADDVFILEDSFLQDEKTDYILPMSRLVGLDMAVSNICAALEADNVLLKKKGPLGAWTHDAAATKDSVAGYIPMTKTERAEVQRDLDAYGVSWSQYQSLVTRQPIKWQGTSFNVTELGTSDTLVKGTKEICHRFNYSYTLLEESESTFSANGVRSHQALYQNNVIPSRMKDDEKYEKYFKMSENNCKFVADFSWLPVMQPDKKVEAETLKAQTEALLLQYKEGIITKNKMLEGLGLDTIPGADTYVTDDTSEDALAIRIGAEGMTSFIALLNAPLTEDNKRNALIILFGLSEEEARLLTEGNDDSGLEDDTDSGFL